MWRATTRREKKWEQDNARGDIRLRLSCGAKLRSAFCPMYLTPTIVILRKRRCSLASASRRRTYAFSFGQVMDYLIE